MTYKSFIESNTNIEKEAIILLIMERLNKKRWEININDEIDICLLNDFEQLKNNIPVQYILGYTYFYKSKFQVNSNVLIPRFDTEILVEESIKVVNKYNNPKVIDLCTGSGCIGISLKKEIPNLNIICSDISSDALEVARYNANMNNVKIEMVKSDLLRNFKDKFDIIISNPPYIDINEDIMDLVKNNEPSIALYSENHGMYHYETILDESIEHLNDNGTILFEIPSFKDQEIIDLMTKYYKNYQIIKDNNNLSRVIILKKGL